MKLASEGVKTLKQKILRLTTSKTIRANDYVLATLHCETADDS